MSSIYIQEPPTSGKVLLKTSIGDIDIELWTKEAPKACRNFIQLCLEGYYNGTVFHRLVKGFIVQGGDPNGDGTGGESIYGEPFKDEFHSRLRFIRRGLVAMANAGANDNGSQFFFTLGSTPELQNKHTIFGKITGDTLFNMLKLEDGLVDENERPIYPQKIIGTEILNNPFVDIEPRIKKSESLKSKKDKNRAKGVKNFGLLSFGQEAEGDEQEAIEFIRKSEPKSKSSHDVLNDPKLSKQPVQVLQRSRSHTPENEEQQHEAVRTDTAKQEVDDVAKKIRSKLNSSLGKQTKKPPTKADDHEDNDDDDDDEEDYLNETTRKKKAELKKQADDIRQEISSLKREYQMDKKSKLEQLDQEKAEKQQKANVHSETMQVYLTDKSKYDDLKSTMPKKGSSREAHTLSLLTKFKAKLENVREKKRTDTAEENENENKNENKNDDEENCDGRDDNWLSHELHFVEQGAILAKDAATKEDDWYDVYDPRNPLNKRRRGEKRSQPGSGAPSTSSVSAQQGTQQYKNKRHH